MKNPLHYIHKYPHRTRQILGISYEQFLSLVKQAVERHSNRLGGKSTIPGFLTN